MGKLRSFSLPARILSAALTLFALIHSADARAAPGLGPANGPAVLRPVDGARARINGLTWTPPPSNRMRTEDPLRNIYIFPVKPIKDGVVQVTISGKFALKDSTLVINRRVVRSPGGVETAFEFPMEIRQEDNEITLVSIDPYGKVQQQIWLLKVPGEYFRWLEIPDRRRFIFKLGIGGSLIDYAETQTNVDRTYKSSSLTGKFGMTYVLVPKRWDLGVLSYMTVMPLSHAATVTNQINKRTANTDTSVRFFGLNVRVGYSVPRIAFPWNLSLQTGVYYTNMFINGSPLGFVNLQGPQLYPVLRYQFRSRQSIVTYFKFSPVSDGFTLLSFTNRELAGGMAYTFPLENFKSFGITLDVADLRVNLPRRDNYTGRLNTYTVGVEYNF